MLLQLPSGERYFDFRDAALFALSGMARSSVAYRNPSTLPSAARARSFAPVAEENEAVRQLTGVRRARF